MRNLATLMSLLAVLTLPGSIVHALQPDRNPLQRFLPPSTLFMPVPSGRLAVTGTTDPAATIEDQRDSRKGGMVYGYCLTSSCSYITHLVIAQVCNNRIGGKDGSEKLILGIVKLPIGGRPGYLHSLQGRNYAENFLLYGPSEMILPPESEEESALYALTVEGMGPVAPLLYDGMGPSPAQPPETLAVRLTTTSSRDRSRLLPRFEVRHLCRSPLS